MSDEGKQSAEDATDETGVPAASSEADREEGPPTRGGPPSADANRQARLVTGLRIGRWLLPPLFAALAVGVHFGLNVPDEPVIEGNRDQGAKADKAKRSPRRPKRPKHQPRPGPELDRLFDHYKGTAFETEPVVGKWARETQTMLNKAVVMARKQAFDGAPEEPRIVATRIQCRTIRCRFVLRSPFAHEIELMTTALQRLETGGQRIWRTFDVAPSEPPDRKGRNDDAADDGGDGKDEQDADTYVEVTVTLIADGIEGDNLELEAPAQGGE